MSVGDAVLCFALQCAHMVVRLVFPADHTTSKVLQACESFKTGLTDALGFWKR